MIFSLKLLLAVFMLIDLLLAWRYANDRDICKVVIFCTAAICGVMSLCKIRRNSKCLLWYSECYLRCRF